MDTTRNKAKALLFLIIVCLCLTGCERPFTVFVGLDKSTAAAEFEKMPASDESVEIVYADDRKIALSNDESFICFDIKEGKLSPSFILPWTHYIDEVKKRDINSRLGNVVPNSDGTLYLLETLPEIFLIDIAKNTMYSVYVRAVNPSDNVIRANFVTDTEIAVLDSGQVFLINLDTGAKTELDCGSLDVRSVHKYKDKIYLTVIDGIYSFDQHSKTAQKLHSHVYNEPFYPYVGFTLSASILTSDKKSIILNSGRPRFYGLFNFESGQFQAFDVGVAATWQDGSPSQIGADEEAVLTRENRYKSSPEANEPLYFSADKIYSINHLEFNEKFIDFKIDVFDFSDIKNPVATYTYK